MKAASVARPRFIVTSDAGQLGNRLFFYAYVISLAQKFGSAVVNPGFSDFAQDFEATRGDALCQWPAVPPAARRQRAGWLACRAQIRVLQAADRLGIKVRGVRVIGVHESRTADFRSDNSTFLNSLRGAQRVLIGGWLVLGEVRFEEPAPIRAHFTPVATHRETNASIVTRARRGADLLIGVHLRQGDYATFLGGRYFYPLEAYIEVMRATARLFPGKNVRFVACSDAPRATFPDDLGEVSYGAGNAVADMYLLAECDYILGPPSTFSLWASFHGQKPLWEMQRADSRPRLEEFLIRF